MADISAYISAIERASRGEEVRDSIIQALNAINTQGGNAATLDGHPGSDYALKEWVREYMNEQLSGIDKRYALKTWVESYVSEIVGDIGQTLDGINGIVI